MICKSVTAAKFCLPVGTYEELRSQGPDGTSLRHLDRDPQNEVFVHIWKLPIARIDHEPRDFRKKSPLLNLTLDLVAQRHSPALFWPWPVLRNSRPLYDLWHIGSAAVAHQPRPLVGRPSPVAGTWPRP